MHYHFHLPSRLRSVRRQRAIHQRKPVRLYRFLRRFFGVPLRFLRRFFVVFPPFCFAILQTIHRLAYGMFFRGTMFFRRIFRSLLRFGCAFRVRIGNALLFLFLEPGKQAPCFARYNRRARLKASFRCFRFARRCLRANSLSALWRRVLATFCHIIRSVRRPKLTAVRSFWARRTALLRFFRLPHFRRGRCFAATTNRSGGLNPHLRFHFASIASAAAMLQVFRRRPICMMFCSFRTAPILR